MAINCAEDKDTRKVFGSQKNAPRRNGEKCINKNFIIYYPRNTEGENEKYVHFGQKSSNEKTTRETTCKCEDKIKMHFVSKVLYYEQYKISPALVPMTTFCEHRDNF
jgi:hypothetical protein